MLPLPEHADPLNPKIDAYHENGRDKSPFKPSQLTLERAIQLWLVMR
jgi:hypothetical protein